MQSPKKPLNRMRGGIRLRRHAFSAAATHVYWINRFVTSPGKSHPKTVACAEVQALPTQFPSRFVRAFANESIRGK